MDTELDMLLAMLGSVALLLLIVGVGAAYYARCIVTCEQGHALVISKATSTEVCFASVFVPPLMGRVEVMDVRAKRVVIERSGKDGVICRDGVRADVGAVFHVRVRPTADDILLVARSMGCARAGDQAVIDELFAAKFSETLATVAKELELEDIVTARDAFRDQIIRRGSEDLAGWVLDDVVIDRLEQTPASALDPDDILDAEGLRKITERTTQAKLRRSELQRKTELQLRQMQAEVEALIIDLERDKAQALDLLRRDTGRSLTERDLEARIEERLRALIRPVVEQVLDERATEQT